METRKNERASSDSMHHGYIDLQKYTFQTEEIRKARASSL